MQTVIETITVAGAHLRIIAPLLVLDLTLGLNNLAGIAPVCATIPAASRRSVLVLGMVIAFLMRVAMLIAALSLTAITHFSIPAGLYLCYLGYRLITQRLALPAPHIDSVPEIAIVRRARYRLALRLALVDAALSIDNVLALAAAARTMALLPHRSGLDATALTPNVGALSSLPSALYHASAAVAVTIPILFIGAAALAPLLRRAKWIGVLGGLVLIYTGLDITLSDPWPLRAFHAALRTLG